MIQNKKSELQQRYVFFSSKKKRLIKTDRAKTTKDKLPFCFKNPKSKAKKQIKKEMTSNNKS